MFEKDGKYYADWRDASGKRLRKSFTSRRAAMAHDAAIVRCIDFEREFAKLPEDTQTILLLAYREKQPYEVISRITGWSLRSLASKVPAALLDLARLLDKADLL